MTGLGRSVTYEAVFSSFKKLLPKLRKLSPAWWGKGRGQSARLVARDREGPLPTDIARRAWLPAPPFADAWRGIGDCLVVPPFRPADSVRNPGRPVTPFPTGQGSTPQRPSRFSFFERVVAPPPHTHTGRMLRWPGPAYRGPQVRLPRLQVHHRTTVRAGSSRGAVFLAGCCRYIALYRCLS